MLRSELASEAYQATLISRGVSRKESFMSTSNLHIRIENATRTDWLDLKRAHGDDAVALSDSKTPTGTFPPFGEPILPTIIIMLTTMAATAFVSWVCKQRSLQRRTLRITITDQNGVTMTIDLSDERYDEGNADATLVADLAKAGLQLPTGGN